MATNPIPSALAAQTAKAARPDGGGEPELRHRPESSWRAKRNWVWVGLASVLAGSLALRLWGVKQGLPYVYNNDENADFLGRAVHMVGGSLNPHYFTNPPAFTYWLHVVLAVWFPSAVHSYATDPTSVFVVARVSVAVLGTGAVWLLYLTGCRLFNRRVGLLAAALETVAFLPVFYAHFALNDAPLLLPITISLLGTAGVLDHGRRRDYVLAGAGLGLACATKYNGGVVLVPLIVAIVLQGKQAATWSRVRSGILLAAVCALGAFVLANPYAVLALHEFRYGIAHQASASSVPKLGAPEGNGLVYYLWSFTWGLGWVPSLAALAGSVLLWRRDRRRWWVLVPVCVLFLIFMGSYARYFGRYMLPILPLVCLLAAYAASQVLDTVARRQPRLRLLAGAIVVVALCGQGLIYSIHSDLIFSRPYTTATARAWMVAHIPPHSRIVVEPVMPADWTTDLPGSLAVRLPGSRWRKYSSLRSVITPSGALDTTASFVVNIEDYERTLSPALIPYYEQHGYCWVVTGSTQSGRAYADPRAAPHAVAYYRALARHAQLAYRVSPYPNGRSPGSLNFDWSFDYYPLGYQQPGPELRVYRLQSATCR